MYNLIIAIGAAVAVALGVKLAGFSIWAGIVPGVIVLLGLFIVLGRRVSLKLQAITQAVQKELQTPAQKPLEQKQRVEKAVKMLEEGLHYEKWQFLVGAEIHAQIGMIKYMVKDLEGAQPHLAKAHARNYMAMAIKAALHFQKKEFDKMRSAFEAAVKSGRKEGLVWSAYAWCLLQLKEKDQALSVMARAVEHNPSDEKLKSGLTALQNDKKLKMKAYEPMWWQFGLEQPPLQAMGGRRVQFVRR